MLTAENLRELLHYDPETGWFTRRKNGKRAGSRHILGYTEIGVFGERHLAHRLAILYQTGAWPPLGVDHINMVRDDNRWSNLRLANQSENSANIKAHKDSGSGIKGVFWHQKANKWRSQIMIRGVATHLGLFINKQDAADAYSKAANDGFGEFARTG